MLIIHNLYVYPIITLCTLNIYNYICQLFLNKVKNKIFFKKLKSASKAYLAKEEREWTEIQNVGAPTMCRLELQLHVYQI